tara:strand:- start:399 stop:668 length:270 start_codon:yes stop_codon:yes gene_type:complete
MAFTTTIDARPHALGDLLLVTGTFTNDDGSGGGDIVLADQLGQILAAGSNANAASAPVHTTEIDGTVTTTLTLVTGANVSGTWWALGKR